jgi:mono/diheme cytochrome c family protein/cytochrome oxidase Cu insertion factor (SCO1/SenC/PrrC family)
LGLKACFDESCILRIEQMNLQGKISVGLLGSLLAWSVVGNSLPAFAAEDSAAASLAAPLKPLQFKDVAGKTHNIADLPKNKATVFFFSSTQCPIANIYSPRMNAIAVDYGAKGVKCFLVNSNAEDTAAKLKKYAAERKFTFPAIKDNGMQLADHLAASRTPEAVVVDGQGVVRYRGRIDDNQDKKKVLRHDVREALDAILAGKEVKLTRTLAFGCTIFREPIKPTTVTASAVTYAKDVAPILFKNCVDCHRDGEAAPFALTTYQQAKVWATAIKDYTTRRQMPPWKATPNFGDFHDARVLSDAQIATLAKWAETGAPAGDLKAVPPLPKFPGDGWILGKPKNGEILASDRPYTLAAEGDDVYQQFVLPVDTSKERYINAIEFRADNRPIVHHIIIYFDFSGKSVELDKASPEPGYNVPNGDGGIGVPLQETQWVAGWAPGNTARFLPEGMAFKMPVGAKVVMQVHYHKTGKTEIDRSQVAFHYVDEEKVDKVVYTNMLINPFLLLKPGVERQKVTAGLTLRFPTEIIAVMPHMHYLGKQITLTATQPDKTVVPMIDIKDWDFNWQETYRYKKPLQMAKGTRLELTAYFDNSEKNPRQPSHPPRQVTWGEATMDEMCIGFFQYAVPRQPRMDTGSSQ